jgi:hypothetical protein
MSFSLWAVKKGLQHWLVRLVINYLAVWGGERMKVKNTYNVLAPDMRQNLTDVLKATGKGECPVRIAQPGEIDKLLAEMGNVKPIVRPLKERRPFGRVNSWE